MTGLKNIILLFFITGCFGMKASCEYELVAWPSAKTVNVNSVFVLMGKKIPPGKFYLRSDKERVELNALTWCTGANGINQILYSPKQRLKANATYTLVDDSSKAVVGIKGEEKAAAISWKTIKDVDELAPQVSEYPTLKETIVSDKNKGEVTFKFSFKGTEPLPMVMLVVCNETGTNNFQVQLVPVQNNSFELKADKCMGGFTFVEGGYYSCKFQLTDACGNIADLSEKAVIIDVPEK